jgi:hypothetical protein
MSWSVEETPTGAISLAIPGSPNSPAMTAAGLFGGALAVAIAAEPAKSTGLVRAGGAQTSLRWSALQVMG